jgi:hypothetical protein
MSGQSAVAHNSYCYCLCGFATSSKGTLNLCTEDERVQATRQKTAVKQKNFRRYQFNQLSSI